MDTADCAFWPVGTFIVTAGGATVIEIGEVTVMFTLTTWGTQGDPPTQLKINVPEYEPGPRLLAFTEAEKEPGAFAEPPLTPPPDALTEIAEGPPLMAIAGVWAVLPAWTDTETEAGATEMLTPLICTPTPTLKDEPPPLMEIDPL